jgi:5-methylcytosine-specific restriction endonuclease McrA
VLYFLKVALFWLGVWILGHFCKWLSDLYSKLREKLAPPKTAEQIEQERLQLVRLQQELQIRKVREEEQWRRRREIWRENYAGYLRSPKWRRVRANVLRKANHICEECGGRATHVHHRRYSNWHGTGEVKRERHDDLQALCTKCHMRKHGRIGAQPQEPPQ